MPKPAKKKEPKRKVASKPARSPKERASRGRSSAALVKAVDVAPARAAAAPLSKEERFKLAEAVRLGEEARRDAEGALVGYGQWLLVNVFGDDTTEALSHKRVNPVWQELVGLAGGSKLRLSRTSLHLALAIAAYDKRLNDEAFRALDVSRKRLVLTLGDDKRIRDAAQHISATKMTAASAQVYVRSLLGEGGERPTLRMTPASAGARVTRAASLFSDRALLGKWKSQLGELSGASRAEASAQLRAIAKAVGELLEALRKEQ